MEFNVSKCHTMHIGKSNPKFSYRMGNQQLDSVISEKDLGVTMLNNLKNEAQCLDSYSKARQMLGMLKRTITARNREVLIPLHKSLVRPHLEYCSSAWSPHYQKDKDLIKKVQHRFTRMFADLKPLPYDDRLHNLGIWSLEERRNRADLIEVFKIVKGLSSVPLNRFFTLSHNEKTRGHHYKLIKTHCTNDVRKYFFSVRVVNRWNNLPVEAVSVNTVNSFKSHLEKLRKAQMDFFRDTQSN